MTKKKNDASPDGLVMLAREAVKTSGWIVGECASQWKEKTGGTDGYFAGLVGLSDDQVFEYRSTFEQCGAFRDVPEFASLSFGHFAAVRTAEDHEFLLRMAVEQKLSIRQLKRYRSSLGEDVEVVMPVEEASSAVDAEDGVSSSVPPLELVERDPAEETSDTLDAQQDLKAERATSQEPHDPKGDEKLAELRTDRRKYLTTIRRLLKSHPLFRYLLADDLDQIAEQIRQDTEADEVVGMEKTTFEAVLKQAKEAA